MSLKSKSLSTPEDTYRELCKYKRQHAKRKNCRCKYPIRAALSPSTQSTAKTQHTSLPETTRASLLSWSAEVSEISLIAFLTRHSFHQDFTEVHKDFYKEPVTSLFPPPGYTRLICCMGGTVIHQ